MKTAKNKPATQKRELKELSLGNIGVSEYNTSIAEIDNHQEGEICVAEIYGDNEAEAKERAEKIINAWNMHEELVQALIKLKSQMEKIDDEFNDPALNDLIKQAEDK